LLYNFFQNTYYINAGFISITQYRNIDRGFIDLTISHHPKIARYRAQTHISCVHSLPVQLVGQQYEPYIDDNKIIQQLIFCLNIGPIQYDVADM